MMTSVRRLDEASHTVRLALGSSDDGSRKGNTLSPAVVITPAMLSALASKGERYTSGPQAAAPSRRERRPQPSSGAAFVQGMAP